MKNFIILLLSACIVFCSAGCSATDNATVPAQATQKIFYLNSYNLQIVADDTFYENTAGSFDLQITNDQAYISIMAYNYIDLPQDATPRDVYDVQNDDIFSKRDAVAVVEETTTHSLSASEVTYGVYSAERDGVKNYYATYLIDIPAQETFAWVLITAVPSYYVNNTDYLHNITCSLAATDV